ncbi:MAG: hypothetical protein ACOC1K_06155 [Nanoarchaeota archaeon]
MFNGWTFKELMPDLEQKFIESFEVLSPIAYLVIGGLLAFFVLEKLTDIIISAFRIDDDE